MDSLHVRTTIYGLLALLAAAVVSAAAVYMLRFSSIPLVLVSLGICVYAALAARTALKPVMLDVHAWTPRKYLIAVATFLVMLAPVYVICQLMLFLADEWRILWKIHPGLKAALRFPDSVVQGILNFVSAVWDAFTGDDPVRPRVKQRTPPEPTFFSALLGWALGSIREIVVGATSAVLAAFVLRRMNR